jgi:hypothetical protein
VKILLHIGQGKTGTTSLQRSLHLARSALREAGVLYPHFGGKAFAHHLLLPLCEDPNRLPAAMVDAYGGPEAAAEKAWAAWNETCDQVLANPPDVLVLSSEFLIHQTDATAKARLAETLSELSSDITPVIYIRHPVDHYRARLQEWLKTESRPLPPTRLPLREAITDCEAAFGRPPVLVAFDRAHLVGQDITTDFLSRFLSDHIATPSIPLQQANIGLSAEALVLAARLRAQAGTPRAARNVIRLLPTLAALDQSDPPDQAFSLLPDVADAALRAATCHRWLVETGRLAIPGLDITAIGGAKVPDWMFTAAPETLFPHDPLRLDRLMQALADDPAASTSVAQ